MISSSPVENPVAGSIELGGFVSRTTSSLLFDGPGSVPVTEVEVLELLVLVLVELLLDDCELVVEVVTGLPVETKYTPTATAATTIIRTITSEAALVSAFRPSLSRTYNSGGP